MNATTVERPSRAILEDRWAGLMLKGLNPSDLQNGLDAMLDDIVEGVLRRRVEDRDGGLIDELERTIRDRVLAYGESEGER